MLAYIGCKQLRLLYRWSCNPACLWIWGIGLSASVRFDQQPREDIGKPRRLLCSMLSKWSCHSKNVNFWMRSQGSSRKSLSFLLSATSPTFAKCIRSIHRHPGRGRVPYQGFSSSSRQWKPKTFAQCWTTECFPDLPVWGLSQMRYARVGGVATLGQSHDPSERSKSPGQPELFQHFAGFCYGTQRPHHPPRN